MGKSQIFFCAPEPRELIVGNFVFDPHWAPEPLLLLLLLLVFFPKRKLGKHKNCEKNKQQQKQNTGILKNTNEKL